ncbi:MAG: hypothetical protein JRG71_10220 [Deltaproteobacteria bacterium]|nr:hypothetical protein [Deltaproteobacteria bacterium]
MSKVNFPTLKEENSVTYLSNGSLSVGDIVDFIAEGGLEATFRYNDQDRKFVLANNPEEHYLDIEGEWFRKLAFGQFAAKRKTPSGFDYGYRYDLWLSPDKIFVSREEAERFEKFGPKKDNHTAQHRSSQEIVKDGRKQGRDNYEIAAMIDGELTGVARLTNREVGILLPANPGASVEKDTERKQGYRLRKKAS